MPPLIYDAKAQSPSPKLIPGMIVVVRRVRVRPTLIFQGRVEGIAVAAVTPTQPARSGRRRECCEGRPPLPAIPSSIRRP